MKYILLTLFFVTSLSAYAEKVSLTNLDFKKVGTANAEIQINFKGNLTSDPELTIKNSMVQVVIPDAEVWPKIEKKVTLRKTPFDTTLMAYQFDKNTVRVRALLPFSLKKLEDKVSITIKGNSIFLHLPQNAKLAKRNKKVVRPSKKQLQKEISYDEAFLDKLLADKNEKLGDQPNSHSINKNPAVSEDKVRSILSSNEKVKEEKSKNNYFDFAKYAGKFVAFLGLVLLLFYFIASFFKKGVLKKGRLGFLNKTSVLEVLSTTYLGPKKSLMLVRAHNQIFLISNTEKDIQFLSEVKDVNGLIKNGEKEITGTNFDTNLLSANSEKKDFKIKDLGELTQKIVKEPGKNESGKYSSDMPEIKKQPEKVKFSEQIKNKLKDLKPLQ
jgi:flagellar biogenesis protein FliO